MAAEALEQSVLEAKDKDQLLIIAQALGIKTTARAAKATLINKILESTGALDLSPAAAAPAAMPPAEPNSDVAPTPTTVFSGAADRASPGAARVVLGADGEPLADWELDLIAAGETPQAPAPAARGAANKSASATTSPATPRRAEGRETSNGRTDHAVDDRADGDAGSHDGDGGDAGEAGDAGDGDGDGDGESRNSRRRRRRRNKNGRVDAPAAGGADAHTDRAERFERTPGRGDQYPDRGGQNQQQGQQYRQQDAPGQQAQGSSPGQHTNQSDRPDRGDQSSTGFGQEPVEVTGYLDLRDEGYGFLRVNGYLASRDDAYIPVKLTRQYGLRKGDHVTGLSRPAGRNEKNPAMLEIHTVNGGDPDKARGRRNFEDLTALFPDEKLRLENPADPNNMTARIVDLISPIGKGQRGIIVSPPKAGKTTIMKMIATSIERNHPEVKLMVLLIDERPEEVTDMRRTVKGEVISSTFDRPSEEHTHVAELAIEKAKRMVEMGEDVVIILDGITRLSRAYNLAAPASGRILSGGIDAGALYPPKRFFGAARNVEEGGSLTILATALVETNSRMDDAIFEEFKGTGNMELRLDRKLAERRIYPAIDVDASSTRHEELLFDPKQLQMVWKLRRVLSGLAADGNAAPGLELLVDRLKTFRTNDEFLSEISKQPST